MKDIKFCPTISGIQHLPVFPHYCHIDTFFLLKNSCVFSVHLHFCSAFALCSKAPGALITSGISLTGLYYHVRHISYFESQCLLSYLAFFFDIGVKWAYYINLDTN